MEIIIAILWYLQVFFTSATYTMPEVNAMIMQNQTAIESVQSNSALTSQILNDYMLETNNDPMSNVIEPWEEEPPEPILD